MASISEHIKAFIHFIFFWLSFVKLPIPFAISLLFVQFFKFLRSENVQKKLEGKVVLITGASSGLGEALAHAFYKVGCKVILSSRREAELERVRDELLQMYKTSPTYPPVVLPLDISEIDAVFKQAEKALSIFGYVDILVNNAGISYRGDVLSTTVDVDEKIMKINYIGPVALTKAILPNMIERKEGHIVAISSLQGLISLPYRSAYSASKHALQAFHDCLRAEVAQNNIRVSVFSPYYIKTNLSVNALTGNGQQYGVMDESTAKGYDPTELADILVKHIANEKKEYVAAPLPPKIVVALRRLYPPLYFWIMKKRAEKFPSLKNDNKVEHSSESEIIKRCEMKFKLC